MTIDINSVPFIKVGNKRGLTSAQISLDENLRKFFHANTLRFDYDFKNDVFIWQEEE